MAVRRVTITYCDECGAEPAESYRIGLPNEKQTHTIDLCSAHSRPIRKLLDRTPRRTNDRRRKPVVTLEQIELMKAQHNTRS